MLMPSMANSLRTPGKEWCVFNCSKNAVRNMLYFNNIQGICLLLLLSYGFLKIVFLLCTVGCLKKLYRLSCNTNIMVVYVSEFEIKFHNIILSISGSLENHVAAIHLYIINIQPYTHKPL